jgi:hypothetical protein
MMARRYKYYSMVASASIIDSSHGFVREHSRRELQVAFCQLVLESVQGCRVYCTTRLRSSYWKVCKGAVACVFHHPSRPVSVGPARHRVT